MKDLVPRVQPLGHSALLLAAMLAASGCTSDAPSRQTPQEMTAEETFKRIEETLAKARTIHAKFRLESNNNNSNGISGSVLLKEGNRARLEVKKLEGGTLLGAMLVVSDGKNLGMPGNPSTTPTPARLNEALKWSLLHNLLNIGGEFVGVMKTGAFNADKWEISNLRFGEDDGANKTLAYTWTARGNSGIGAVEVRLWYDPNTYGIRKRTFDRTDHQIYEVFTLDGKLSDDSFKIDGK